MWCVPVSSNVRRLPDAFVESYVESQMNRYRIVGAIALIWGGALLLSHFIGSSQIKGDGAYATGQYAGLVFGGLLFVAGLYAVIRGGRKKP